MYRFGATNNDLITQKGTKTQTCLIAFVVDQKQKKSIEKSLRLFVTVFDRNVAKTLVSRDEVIWLGHKTNEELKMKQKEEHKKTEEN